MAGELPQNEFAEKTVLGIALLDKKQAFNILTTLSPEDFYCSNFKNREIGRRAVGLRRGTALSTSLDRRSEENTGSGKMYRYPWACGRSPRTDESFETGMCDVSLLGGFGKRCQRPFEMFAKVKIHRVAFHLY